MPFGLGSIFKIALLLINAMAVLNEERFLTRSKLYKHLLAHFILNGEKKICLVGWTSQSQQLSQQTSFHQPYDPYTGMGGNTQQELSVKAKLVNLIGAVRTLMRGKFNIPLYSDTNKTRS